MRWLRWPGAGDAASGLAQEDQLALGQRAGVDPAELALGDDVTGAVVRDGFLRDPQGVGRRGLSARIGRGHQLRDAAGASDVDRRALGDGAAGGVADQGGRQRGPVDRDRVELCLVCRRH